MKVHVSEADIKKGIKTVTSNTHCPVARAIRRATGKRNVLVGVNWYIIGKKYTCEGEKMLPVIAVNFINTMLEDNFDRLEPFTFSIAR